jgi:hypothetical protein
MEVENGGVLSFTIRDYDEFTGVRGHMEMGYYRDAAGFTGGRAVRQALAWAAWRVGFPF